MEPLLVEFRCYVLKGVHTCFFLSLLFVLAVSSSHQYGVDPRVSYESNLSVLACQVFNVLKLRFAVVHLLSQCCEEANLIRKFARKAAQCEIRFQII